MLGREYIGCSRGPFAGGEALHASLDGGIDEVFLGDAARVRLRDNEREHCMDALQDSCQLLWVLIARLGPCYVRPGVFGGNVLFMSAT